jgi:hypothetical protein
MTAAGRRIGRRAWRGAARWIVALGVATSASTVHTQAPDFSGYWQLDLARSHVSADTQTMWLHVDQTSEVVQANLRAFQAGGGEENQVFVYSIGTADNHNTMHGGPMTSRVGWNGPALEFHSEVLFGTDRLTMDDTWTLSADADTLTYRQVSQFAREVSREAIYVFSRRPAAAWPPVVSNEPAEKAFPNIKVLTGRPASDVPVVMATFTHALGVSCSYCHVPGSFALEDKPQLLTAREMYRMTSTFGTGLLADRGGLTCWTCHRGQPKPARFPSAELQPALAKWPADLASAPDGVKLTMTVYARSLGVTCEFCHVPGDWKSQAKAPMRTVPTMLALFTEMPKLSPVAANRSQCWMCHQGQRTPERAPTR